MRGARDLSGERYWAPQTTRRLEKGYGNPNDPGGEEDKAEMGHSQNTWFGLLDNTRAELRSPQRRGISLFRYSSVVWGKHPIPQKSEILS